MNGVDAFAAVAVMPAPSWARHQSDTSRQARTRS